MIFKEDLEAIFGKRQWGIEETPLLVDEEIFEDDKTEEETSVQEETKSEESISETTSEDNVNTDTTIDTEEK